MLKKHMNKIQFALAFIILVLVMSVSEQVVATNNLLQQEVDNFAEELNFNNLLDTLQEFTQGIDLKEVGQNLISRR